MKLSHVKPGDLFNRRECGWYVSAKHKDAVLWLRFLRFVAMTKTFKLLLFFQMFLCTFFMFFSTHAAADANALRADVSSKKTTTSAGTYGSTSRLDKGYVRWMAVSLANDESYVMVGKSAGESGDPASSWNTVRFIVNEGKDDTIVVDDTYYDGTKGVLFRGVQKAPKDLRVKTYKPIFEGKAEIRGGGGGGGPASYEWKVFAGEPITRGVVTIKSWFVYSDTLVVVSGDSYSLGPVVAPPGFITQVWAEDLFIWWLQDTGQRLWDNFCDQLSERVLEWLGDFGTLINDLRSFTNSINSRMNMIHRALEASGAAGSNLDFFQINATANGALRAVYTENGVEKTLNLTFSIEGVGQYEFFGLRGVLEALKDDKVINIIYNKVRL